MFVVSMIKLRTIKFTRRAARMMKIRSTRKFFCRKRSGGEKLGKYRRVWEDNSNIDRELWCELD